MPFKNLSELIAWELSQNKRPNTGMHLSGDDHSGDKLANSLIRKLRYLSSKSSNSGSVGTFLT